MPQVRTTVPWSRTVLGSAPLLGYTHFRLLEGDGISLQLLLDIDVGLLGVHGRGHFHLPHRSRLLVAWLDAVRQDTVPSMPRQCRAFRARFVPRVFLPYTLSVVWGPPHKAPLGVGGRSRSEALAFMDPTHGEALRSPLPSSSFLVVQRGKFTCILTEASSRNWTHSETIIPECVRREDCSTAADVLYLSVVFLRTSRSRLT